MKFFWMIFIVMLHLASTIYLKIATIEKHVIEFQYFTGKEFIKYRAEPYELRIKEDIWKLLIEM